MKIIVLNPPQRRPRSDQKLTGHLVLSTDQVFPVSFDAIEAHRSRGHLFSEGGRYLNDPAMWCPELKPATIRDYDLGIREISRGKLALIQFHYAGLSVLASMLPKDLDQIPTFYWKHKAVTP